MNLKTSGADTGKHPVEPIAISQPMSLEADGQ